MDGGGGRKVGGKTESARRGSGAVDTEGSMGRSLYGLLWVR